MKRLAMLLIGVVLASTIIPAIAVEAQPRLVPHENPAAAQSSLDSYSFLIQYAQIFALVSAEQYTNASKLSQLMSHISVPAGLTYIVNRYNNLTQQFINTLSQLQTTLDNASSLINQNRLSEAAVNLNKAGVLVAQAEILLSELQDATKTLSQQLGVLAAPAESKVAQAYNSLQSLLQKLSILINQYHSLLDDINNLEQNRAKQLEPTTLTLQLNTQSVFVGGNVIASGNLRSSYQALQSRSVSLLLGGVRVATALSGSSGSFSVEITIPYDYIPVMIVQALYTPTGEDSNVYAASLSPAISVNVSFYITKVNVSVADVAYPALPLTVSGSVTSQAGMPLGGRTVELLFDNSMVNQAETASNGFFSTQMSINSQAPIGSHTLTVTVKPNGLYAGVSQQKTVNIQKMVSTVNVLVPSFVLLPSEIQIKGTVSSSSGPLNNAIVIVHFDSTNVVTETLSDGSFNVRVNAPLNIGLGSFQSLTVTVQPQQPWQAATTHQSSIFALNAVGLGITLVSAISVGFVTFSRFVNPKPQKQKKTASSDVSTVSGEAGLAQMTSQPELVLEGAKGKVLEAYINALKAVVSATGVSLKLDMTLREFFHETEGKLGEVAPQFGELTMLAEQALYSSRIPQKPDLLKAKQLASKIIGGLVK